MKLLTCEMCGSTDIIKQDGVFVCQSCGCKYSVEEAKKMMVEIAGSVKIDKSDDLENYIKLAESSVKGCNWDKANEYASKALEIDPENSCAWLLKMKSTRFSRGKSCAESAQNAIKFADPSKLRYTEIEVYTHFCEAFDSILPGTLINQNTGVGYLEAFITPEILAKYDEVLRAYKDKMSKATAALETDVKDKQSTLDLLLKLHIDNVAKCKTKSEIEQFLTQGGKEEIAKKRLEDSKEIEHQVKTMMSDKIVKATAIRKEASRKKYWEEHADEKAVLETEKSDLAKQINMLEKEITGIESVSPPDVSAEEIEVQRIQDQIKKLSDQKTNLGLFKGKEKKALQDKINSANTSLQDVLNKKDAIVNEFVKERDKKITAVREKMDLMQNRIREINKEFNKDR